MHFDRSNCPRPSLNLHETRRLIRILSSDMFVGNKRQTSAQRSFSWSSSSQTTSGRLRKPGSLFQGTAGLGKSLWQIRRSEPRWFLDASPTSNFRLKKSGPVGSWSWPLISATRGCGRAFKAERPTKSFVSFRKKRRNLGFRHMSPPPPKKKRRKEQNNGGDSPSLEVEPVFSNLLGTICPPKAGLGLRSCPDPPATASPAACRWCPWAARWREIRPSRPDASATLPGFYR